MRRIVRWALISTIAGTLTLIGATPASSQATCMERAAPSWIPLALTHGPLTVRHAVTRWIRHALAREAEITVRIVDSDEGRALNRDYRHKDYATNVLTFGYGDDTPLSADLVLCAPVVAAEAQQAGKSLQAHYAHLLVHGTLHAQGYDHEVDDEAEAMEARETEVMLALGLPDPYAHR